MKTNSIKHDYIFLQIDNLGKWSWSFIIIIGKTHHDIFQHGSLKLNIWSSLWFDVKFISLEPKYYVTYPILIQIQWNTFQNVQYEQSPKHFTRWHLEQIRFNCLQFVFFFTRLGRGAPLGINTVPHGLVWHAVASIIKIWDLGGFGTWNTIF